MYTSAPTRKTQCALGSMQKTCCESVICRSSSLGDREPRARCDRLLNVSEGQTLEAVTLERVCPDCGLVDVVSAPSLEKANAAADLIGSVPCGNCDIAVIAPFRLSKTSGVSVPER